MKHFFKNNFQLQEMSFAKMYYQQNVICIYFWKKNAYKRWIGCPGQRITKIEDAFQYSTREKKNARFL